MGAAQRRAARIAGRAAARTLERQPRRAGAHVPPRRALARDDAGTAPARAPRHAPLGTHEPGAPRGNEGAVPGHAIDDAGAAQGTAQALARNDPGAAPGMGRGEPGYDAAVRRVFASSSSSQSKASCPSLSSSETKL